MSVEDQGPSLRQRYGLDIITNLFATSAFLLQIFSAVRFEPPAATGGRPILDVTFYLPADPEVVLNVRLRPPGGAWVEIPLEQVRPDGSWGGSPAGGHFRYLGFSHEGNRLLTGPAAAGAADGLRGRPIGKVVVLNPAPGAWRFDVRYMSRRNLEAWVARGAGGDPPIAVRRVVGGSGAEPMDEHVLLRFAAVSEFAPLVVEPGRAAR